MTATVHDIVARLLALGPGNMSMSTIHRLLYFGQGWNLAWTGEPLFAEEIRLRASGPVVHALFEHQKDGVSAVTWPAGNPGTVTDDTAKVLAEILESYGHLPGLQLGRMAHRHAPCVNANARRTTDEPEPVIDPAEMKAFFTALADAPDDQVDYANRFIANYT